ncbi:DUF418 domain-containing protein [Streptomyces scabiei]|nr:MULTISPECIES: DUF418 domain-containing protein [Streptomyces]MBP5918634.1 DUF418 domain-containing protein [Streptomyces sp. LBUM 1486]MDX3031551.1 DUF418 domain-containing protein [Streptomyces scabiei]MDX3211222.1 DUF418 domain-containing protein [Streptomyces scabiei]QTU52310.1 DUF418 domain-containing protein [Streptomyces sp. LBUM 1480]
MTQIQPPQEAPAPQEHSPPRARTSSESARQVPGGPSMGRLVGVDLARALAVFGMYIVHIGPNLCAASAVGSGSGGMPELPMSELLSAGPHSGTTFDIIGSVGIAILVIVGTTVLIDRLPLLRRLAKPVIAVGTMSLTAYVGHFVAQSLLSSAPGTAVPGSWTPVLTYIVGAIVFAALWSRFFRRGPLEYLLNVATKPAKYIR